jgi:hypothetical protein
VNDVGGQKQRLFLVAPELLWKYVTTSVWLFAHGQAGSPQGEAMLRSLTSEICVICEICG